MKLWLKYMNVKRLCVNIISELPLAKKNFGVIFEWTLHHTKKVILQKFRAGCMWCWLVSKRC